MTIAGVLRSIDAANSRAARNQQRYERLQERRRILQDKLNAIENARLEVEEFEEQIDTLLGVHKEDPTVLNWETIINFPPPLKPTREADFEAIAQDNLAEYTPGFFEKLFGKATQKKKRLEAELLEARKKDDEEYRKNLAKFERLLEADIRKKAVAKAILEGSLDAYQQAIEFINPLGDIIAAGGEAKISIPNKEMIEVSLVVESNTVVPSEIKSLTKTGKVSTKEMPTGRANELYQDFVCGSALRAGREFFALLPVRLVVVHISTHLLNTINGNLEHSTVLSAAIQRPVLERINFAQVDPSDSMALFVHRMGFKKAIGFTAVSKLEPHDYAGQN